ncbi:hypothetical protein V2J09_020685 [Rumex salicifolius]
MDLSAVQHQLHHRYLTHHHQEMDSESLDSIIASSKQQAATSAAVAQDKISNNTKPRPADEEAQKCPRCDSTNTKFCYYNNYSLSQPRYFCKACRRYWTKGGTLRNVPVGGGCRKSNKRPSSPSSLLIKRPHHISNSNITPTLSYGSGGSFDHSHHHIQQQHDVTGPHHAFSFLDSLRHNAGLFHTLGYGASSSSTGEEVLAGNVPYGDVAVGGVKQEGAGSDGRALWGFPWQVMNYGDQNVGAANSSDVESNNIRGSWNGLFGNSAWQGLINSPALI